MRAAGLLLLGCALLAGAAAAQSRPGGAEPAKVYGVEVEATLERDRLLVFADGPLRPKIEEVDRGTVMLSFPGARLDPSAPERITPAAGGVIQSVTVFETADEPREVRVTVLRSAGVSPSLSQRGGQVALDFDRPGEVRQVPDAPTEPTLDVHWINIDPSEAVERLARFLGLRVILDATLLRGTLTIEAQRQVTEDEARALLDSLLLLKGLAAVAAPGNALKILPLTGSPGRWVEALEGEPGGAALLTLVHLEEVDASLAAQALEPLVGSSGLLQVYALSNSVLLGGPQSRLVRIAKVLRELDAAGSTRVVLIPLRYADAEFTADALDGAFDQDPTLRVWPDARTQRLIVRGRHATIEQVRRFVARIDRPAEGRGRLQVIPVQYADAEVMATLLRDLAIQPAESGVPGAESLSGREFAVSVHPPTHSLVVQSDPATIDLVRGVLAELDRPAEQAVVDVGVTEVLITDNLELALDALVPLTSPNSARDLVAAIATNPSGALLDPTASGDFLASLRRTPIRVPVVDPMTGETLVLSIPREAAVVTANATSVNSRVLLNPRLTLISGEEHEIFGGLNVPVPVATAGGQVNALRTSQTVERRDVGVRLRVRPTVTKEGPIVLDLDLHVSSISGSLSGGPTFLERELEAVIRLESGQAAVIASSRQPRSSKVLVGVPFLSDIPILGWLFRRTLDVEEYTHIIITLSATRLHPDADLLTRWMLEELAEEESAVAAGVAP